AGRLRPRSAGRQPAVDRCGRRTRRSRDPQLRPQLADGFAPDPDEPGCRPEPTRDRPHHHRVPGQARSYRRDAVGNDTGGAVCQYTIDTDHSRIGRLVLTNCDAFDLSPPKEFAALITIGRHASLIKPMLTLLRPVAIRHRRNVYGGTFAGEPDPTITRSWIEP